MQALSSKQPNHLISFVPLLSDFSGTERKKRNVDDGGRNALSLFSTFTRDVRQHEKVREGRKERRKARNQKRIIQEIKSKPIKIKICSVIVIDDKIDSGSRKKLAMLDVH